MIKNNIEKILLIRTSAIGDVVMSLPVARTLRAVYPNARIDWAVEETSAPILRDNPDLNETIVLRTKKWRRDKSFSALRDMKRTFKKLREAEYDITLDLQGLIKSGVIARITGAQLRIGYHRSRCREPISAHFNNLHIKTHTDKHIVDQQLEMMRPLGIENMDRRFPINLGREEELYAEEFLSGLGGPESKPVAINPGASWRTKLWAPEKYETLAARIVKELGAQVIVTWGGEEEGLRAEEIARRAGPGVLKAPPTNIRQLAALLGRCGLFVGGDTGPLHIAAAMGVPSVALFGPSDPARNGPYGNKFRVVHHPLSCSGCYRRQCPDPKCISTIEPGEVFQAVCSII